MASEIPATSEVILQTDASKQFLDTFIGQGWDAWGEGLGGSNAAELMLQLFSAFNLVALACISALFIWVLAWQSPELPMKGRPSEKGSARSGCPCALWAQWALWHQFSRGFRFFRWQSSPVSAFPSIWATTCGNWARIISLSMVGSSPSKLLTRMSRNIRQ